MKIRGVELREIQLSLREHFEISSGGWSERRILLLRMETEEGEAWSECVAGEAPTYSYETPETAWHILTDFLLPPVLGAEVEEPADILRPSAWVRGHPMARAAVEMGAWGLKALEEGVSLSTLLGGNREAVPAGVSVGLQKTDDELLKKVEEHLASGYRKIKLKIKPGRDVEMVRAVRDRFPEAPLMVDANSAYTLDDASRLQELDDLNLMMVEQPLDSEDLRQHALLQARMTTPICLDESIRSAEDTRLALQLGSGGIINIKPGRVGGFTSSTEIHDICAEAGIPVWCGGMLESGVGRAYNVALASLPNFLLPGDISESRRYWEEDVVEPEFVMADGLMPVPSGGGMGVEVRRDRVGSLTTRRLWLCPITTSGTFRRRAILCAACDCLGPGSRYRRGAMSLFAHSAAPPTSATPSSSSQMLPKTTSTNITRASAPAASRKRSRKSSRISSETSPRGRFQFSSEKA